jgi:hypothetical protein
MEEIDPGLIHVARDLNDKFLRGKGDACRSRRDMELQNDQTKNQQGKKEKNPLLSGRVGPARLQTADGGWQLKGRTQRF